MDAAFELLYHFTPRIGLAFGYGYLSGGKKAESAEITAVGLDIPFTATPRFDWEANRSMSQASTLFRFLRP